MRLGKRLQPLPSAVVNFAVFDSPGSASRLQPRKRAAYQQVLRLKIQRQTRLMNDLAAERVGQTASSGSRHGRRPISLTPAWKCWSCTGAYSAPRRVEDRRAVGSCGLTSTLPCSRRTAAARPIMPSVHTLRGEVKVLGGDASRSSASSKTPLLGAIILSSLRKLEPPCCRPSQVDTSLIEALQPSPIQWRHMVRVRTISGKKPELPPSFPSVNDRLRLSAKQNDFRKVTGRIAVSSHDSCFPSMIASG